MPRAFLPVALALVLAGCGQELTVEQQVIAVIRTMEAELEAGERREFMAHVAEDFAGQSGRMNRDQVRALVVFQLRRYERLQAQLFPIRVTETGPETAGAEFRALITGGPGWIPESGQVYEFSTAWRRRDGDWVVVSADWRPVPLDEVLDKLPTPGRD